MNRNNKENSNERGKPSYDEIIEMINDNPELVIKILATYGNKVSDEDATNMVINEKFYGENENSFTTIIGETNFKEERKAKVAEIKKKKVEMHSEQEDNDMRVNHFVKKTIRGNGKCGISAMSFIINFFISNKMDKISDATILSALYKWVKTNAKKYGGKEILSFRKTDSKGKVKDIECYKAFLQEIERSDVVKADQYLINQEIGVIAEVFKMNVIILHDSRNDVHKRYLFGKSDEMVFFIKYGGLHYDVWMLAENSIYIEEEFLNGGKLQVIGEFDGRTNYDYNQSEFWRSNPNAISEQDFLNASIVYEDEDEGKSISPESVTSVEGTEAKERRFISRRDWANDLSDSEDDEDDEIIAKPKVSSKVKKVQRDSLEGFKSGAPLHFVDGDYTGVNLNSSPGVFMDHRLNSRRLSGNSFEKEKEKERKEVVVEHEKRLKDVLKMGKQGVSKVASGASGGGDPPDDSSSSSSSSESIKSSRSIPKRVRKDAEKYAKRNHHRKGHNRNYVSRDDLGGQFISEYLSRIPRHYEHLSRAEMIAENIYVTTENFMKLRENEKPAFFSEHLDSVEAYQLDPNNSMYRIAITSTLDIDVKVEIVNNLIVQAEYGAFIMGNRDRDVIIDNVPAFNRLSDEQAVRAIMVANAPQDLQRGVSILKAVSIVPKGKEDYYKDVVNSDLTVYNYQKAFELILNYMKRFESQYRKLVECCPNKEAIPQAYSKGIVYGGGMRIGSAIDILLNRLTEGVNQLLASWFSNLTDTVKEFLRGYKERSAKVASGDRDNLVTRFVRYAHRAILQYQKAFDGVRTTIRMGQKKWVKEDDRGRGNLKVLQRDKMREREDEYLDEEGYNISDHVDDRIFLAGDNPQQRRVYDPPRAGNRHDAALAMSKLPCFLMSNCPNIKTCKYCHSVEVYEKFMKTMVEYVKTLKSQGPSLKVIEDYFETDSEGNRLVIDDDIMLNFMTSCMAIVNEQLTPAHIGTEIVRPDSEGRLRK